MKKMPTEIKRKLRQLQRTTAKAMLIESELVEMFKEYGIDTDCLRGEYVDKEGTEALTYINYNEGKVEENIQEIERVFLYYVNGEKY